jgi:hypothetical protein
MDISWLGEVLKIVSSVASLLANLFKKDSKKSLPVQEPVPKDSIVLNNSPVNINKLEVHINININYYSKPKKRKRNDSKNNKF